MHSAPRHSGKLRIVGGSLRGSRIDVPDHEGLRPTSDRVRETLFNWLAPVIEGARCVDLFAGTGALGIEAISRGAAGCVFVERERHLAHALEGTLMRLKVGHARVLQADALAWLGQANEPADLVFLDPPFAENLWSEVSYRLEAGGSLAANARIYLEAPLDIELSLPQNWQVHREGKAGNVRFMLYRRAELG